jgi:predicted MFS family arabinose efflux permease
MSSTSFWHSLRRSPAVLAALLLFLAVESTAVASLGTPLLPLIEDAYQVSLASSQWTLTVTLLIGAVATPLMGRLGDGKLRRQTVIGGVVVMFAGCLFSALPAGFAMFIVGRGLQGVGFGLIPLATVIARDNLSVVRSRSTISLIGITTAAGVGIGYPLVGLLAQYLGLAAPFWFVTALTALVLVAAAVVLPESPPRMTHIDFLGAALLGLGLTSLLLALAEGPRWGWTSAPILAAAGGSVAMLGIWVGWELHVVQPLIELRLLRLRSVQAANVTAFLVAVGFYPLLPLVVRFVQTPAGLGYGFAASVVTAGLMLTPFSLASVAASRFATWESARWSSELVVAASCIVLICATMQFLLTRSSYWDIVSVMALTGFGVGCVYAVNPMQITGAVPAAETGGAISFYQVVRAVAYALGSALSATVLELYIFPGQNSPTNAGYSTAAMVCTAILIVALLASSLFAAFRERPARLLASAEHAWKRSMCRPTQRPLPGKADTVG